MYYYYILLLYITIYDYIHNIMYTCYCSGLLGCGWVGFVTIVCAFRCCVLFQVGSKICQWLL